jgi:NAD(P)-dependent dehydrogenase (short-subunit alcohol dehydrogenase family)
MSEPVLRGQAALITGGGSGIGLGCATRLVRDGASVTIAGRNEERLRAALGELRTEAAEGASVQHAVCDVTDEGSVEAAVVAAAQLGALRIVVAAAGMGGIGTITGLSLDEWNQVIDTNLTGTFLTFKHAGAAMVAGGDGGAMVAISSIAAARSHPFMGPYSVSKAGIDMLVQVTAGELGRHRIRVNSVRPGVVKTDLGDYLIDDAAVLAQYLDNMPVSRIGQVTDVADAVRFLVGPEATWITGVSLSIDGGHHLGRSADFSPWVRSFFGDEAVDGPGQSGSS